MRWFYFSVLALGWASVGFSAQVFSYRAWSYPVTEKTCQAEADDIAARLRRAGNVEIYEARCESSYRSYEIVVSYVAEQPLAVESTRPFSDHLGSYSTNKNCNDNIPAEVSRFTNATGLRPFVAYCYKTLGTNRAWVVRLDAVGVGKQHLQIFEASIDSPLQSLSEADIVRAAQRAGVDAVTASLHGDIFKPVLTIRYYAERRKPLVMMELGTFSPESACNDRLAETYRTLQSTKAETLAIFCGRPYMSVGAIMYWFHSQAREWVGRVNVNRHYDSFEACEMDRPVVIDFMKNKLKRPGVFAVMCEGRDGRVISTPLERSQYRN